jgi:hypothetical protein
VSRIVYRYVYMTEIVAAALEVLREKSPVGTGPEDKHPGLYRDSHMVFIDGHVVKDVSRWQSGQQINISNPVPYARKIEGAPGRPTIVDPGHVYEMASGDDRLRRYSNSVNIKFVFMPVRFGSVQDYAKSLVGRAAGKRRGGNLKARRDWLIRQPALQITER